MVKPWKDHRGEITRLYIQEGLTLAEVQAIMRDRHNFEASIRSYRQHFDQWGLQKYNCKKRQQRRRQNQGMLPSPPRTPHLGLKRQGAEGMTFPPSYNAAPDVGGTVTARSPGHHPSYPPHFYLDSQGPGCHRPHMSHKFLPAGAERLAQRRLPEVGYGKVAIPLPSWYQTDPPDPESSLDGSLSPLFDQGKYVPPMAMGRGGSFHDLSGFQSHLA